MAEPDDEEVAARFGEIIATERLSADPVYQVLVADVNLACAKLFNHMRNMGHGDIDGIKTSIVCPKGHTHPLFKIEKLEEDDNGSDHQGRSH